MTNEDKKALSLKIATLAEAQGIDPALLWEAAEECPQGHDNRSWCDDDVTYGIGELCLLCWNTYWVDPRVKLMAEVPFSTSLNKVYGKEEALGPLYDDPAFHPEWRIGRRPRDLTHPGLLLPVVEAWIAQAMRYRNVIIEWLRDVGQWRVEFLIITQADGWTAVDPDRTIAEAQALCATLEAEKGELS